MAPEKEQQQSAYPARGYVRGVDTEAGAAHTATREERKKKRMKCFVYVVLFIIFQTAVITAFSLTVMKVKTPKFRIRRATVFDLTVGTPANPSLRATINPEFTVKNTNFGRYKYRNTTVEFFYRGTRIGGAFVPNSKAGWLSATKKFVISAVELNLNGGSPQLGSDISAGIVPITSSAQMRGKAELMFIMKKNKATNMNCTMDIVTASRTITNISCK